MFPTMGQDLMSKESISALVEWRTLHRQYNVNQNYAALSGQRLFVMGVLAIPVDGPAMGNVELIIGTGIVWEAPVASLMDAYSRLHAADALTPVERCGGALDKACEPLGAFHAKALDPVETSAELRKSVRALSTEIAKARDNWVDYLTATLGPEAHWSTPAYIKPLHAFRFRSDTPGLVLDVWGLEALPVC